MEGQPRGTTMDFYEDAYYRVAPQQLTAERLEAELKLVVRALDVPQGAHVLDVGCGYGRHAIALAQRGYAVTGIDLSKTSLQAARRSAREAGVRVHWLRRDMRDVPFKDYFEAAICMGAFGVLETDAQDGEALSSVRRALRVGSRFLLDHKNREWQVRHLQPAGRLELPDGAVSEFTAEIDLVGGYRWDYEVFTEADGTRREYSVRERLYTAPELIDLMHAAGLTVLRTWGDYAASEYSQDSPRMIVLAQKL